MNSSRYLKNIYNGDEVPEVLTEIEKDINEEKWKNAEDLTIEIKDTFNKVSRFIQFSVERDELVEFNLNLSLLYGYIKSKDSSNAIAQTHLLKEYWNELK